MMQTQGIARTFGGPSSGWGPTCQPAADGQTCQDVAHMRAASSVVDQRLDALQAQITQTNEKLDAQSAKLSSVDRKLDALFERLGPPSSGTHPVVPAMVSALNPPAVLAQHQAPPTCPPPVSPSDDVT